MSARAQVSAETLSREIARRLAAAADAKTKAWWEAYLKGAIPFRGVNMATIRSIVHDVWAEMGLEELDRDVTIDLALAQFEHRHSEDKIAGVLMLAECLLDDLTTADVERLALPFERGQIADWSTCDWHCVKVLGRFVERSDRRARARAIAGWRSAEALWHRRAAAVTFVYLAPQGDEFFPGFIHLLLEVCASNVQHPERFSQTSVGWLLRELSKAAPDEVREFVEEHGAGMSREAFKAATARLR